MPFAALTLQQVRPRLGILLVSMLVSPLLLAPLTARAEGEDPAVIEKVTNLNKKALDAYDALEFEDARKLLKQALDLCSSAGLDKHPIKARTHVHMGVVLIAAKQPDLGIKQFRKALDIQPDIQVTKALANPEILQAFEEAGAGAPPPPAGGEPGGAEPGGGGSQGPPPGRQEEAADITHMSISRGKRGKPITITATVSPDLTGYTKVVIAYRPQGGGDFVGVDMRRSGNKFIGEIPAEATQGNSVSYYIEAEAEDETAVATSGTEDKPYTVSLSDKTHVGEDEEGDEDSNDDSPRFFVSVLGGTGFGYATGNGEVNADNKVNPGFAPSSAFHVMPEVGYFLNPNLRLSLQLRFQFVSGATPQNLDSFKAAGGMANIDSCGPDHLCSPSTFAFAALARASWFFGSGTFRPYFSLALGGGAIRHIVKFTSLATGTDPGTCGTSGKEACVDTVLAGPIFAGPGGGVLIALTRNFGLVAELGSLLGFPKFTFHLDLNAGVAGRF